MIESYDHVYIYSKNRSFLIIFFIRSENEETLRSLLLLYKGKNCWLLLESSKYSSKSYEVKLVNHPPEDSHPSPPNYLLSCPHLSS